MSSLADEVRVTMLLADYASVDAANKLQILGGGWQVATVLPNGMTAPQYLVVLIEVPSGRVGEEFAVGVSLHDERTGTVVELPGPGGQPGVALRVQQLSKADRPVAPGVRFPLDYPGRVQAILAFPDGLPLPPSGFFSWRLEVDGNHVEHWCLPFVTGGPPPAPVVG